MAIKINNITVIDDSKNLANISGIFTTANSSYGTSGQVLTSNGTAAFWGPIQGGTVTSITAGTGLSGGTITTTGTITLNTAYVATISSNNASFLGGASASLYARLAGPTFTGTVTLPSTTSIGSVSSTEIGYLDNVTSPIQTQLNAKGTVSSITAGTGLTGGTITTTGTIALGTSGVVSGTYTAHGFTVDSFGRITGTSAFRSASTTQQGMVELSASVTSTSNTVAATSAAVKSAYDLAASKGSGTVTSVGISGTNITVSGSPISSSGTITISIPQAITTTSNVQFRSIGVGTAASGTTGEIRATNDITAFYSSDASLKENVKNITNPIDKIKLINGVEFDWAQKYIDGNGGEDPYFMRRHDVGVIAQEIEAVLPEVVATRENGIKAVKYDRIVALLIEAIKEQQKQIEELRSEINQGKLS
jgi:hypothetical protein